MRCLLVGDHTFEPPVRVGLGRPPEIVDRIPSSESMLPDCWRSGSTVPAVICPTRSTASSQAAVPCSCRTQPMSNAGDQGAAEADCRSVLNVPRKLTRSAASASVSSIGARSACLAALAPACRCVSSEWPTAGMRCRDVVTHDLFQRGELPGVHVRRPLCHAAQARCLERALQRRIVAHHESELLALAGLGIAERTQVIELVAAHLGRRTGAPTVGSCGIARRHPGVVELLVGEERPAVTTHALCLVRPAA